jgi:hypothetical protein
MINTLAYYSWESTMIVKGPIIKYTWEVTVNPFTSVMRLHKIKGRVFVTLSHFTIVQYF